MKNAGINKTNFKYFFFSTTYRSVIKMINEKYPVVENVDNKLNSKTQNRLFFKIFSFALYKRMYSANIIKHANLPGSHEKPLFRYQ